METKTSPKIVQSLIGVNQLPFYLKCLKSLTEYCEEEIELILHTDGTLTEYDNESVIANFLNQTVRLSDPKQMEQKVLDNLQGRPHCQRIRRESIWGIEFFDPLFARISDPISLYLDADILFFRPFRGLFNSMEIEGGAVFLKDSQWDSYCLRPWHLMGIGKKPKIVKGMTTAIVCWDKSVIDWDYLEWFLAQTNYHKIPEWVLPTAQAGLATNCQAKTISHKQLPNLYPNAQLTSDTFGVHLLGSYREYWLPKIKQYQQEMPFAQEAISAHFNSCEFRGATGYALNQTKRWVNTRLNKW